MGDDDGADSLVIEGARAAFLLNGELVVGRLAALKTRLLESLARREPVVFDASDVFRIDTAGVQLLCAFCIAARRAEMPITWIATSPRLNDAARVLGLEPVLFSDGGV